MRHIFSLQKNGKFPNFCKNSEISDYVSLASTGFYLYFTNKVLKDFSGGGEGAIDKLLLL